MTDYDAIAYYKRPWRGWVEVSGFDATWDSTSAVPPVVGEWFRATEEPVFSVEAGLALAKRVIAAHVTLAARIVDAGGNVYETIVGVGYKQRTVDKAGETVHIRASERARLLEEALR